MREDPSQTRLRAPLRYLPQLESLRGWAILLVVLFHYFGILSRGDNSALQEGGFSWLGIAAAGNTGVTLFFVLSGFLLAQPFILTARSDERVDIARFYSARLLRIVPLYYLVVMLAWLVSANVNALKALLFIPIGFEVFPFSVPWWSLSTEVQFYLVLPWVMLGLRHRWGRWLVVLGGCIWFAAHGYFFLQPDWLTDHRNAGLQSSLFGRGVAFLVGGLCGWFYLSRGFSWLVRSPLYLALLSLLLGSGLLGLLHWYGVTGQMPALMAMPLYHDLEALLWGGLLICSLGLSGWVKWLFINPLFRHFGSISYSLYLVHLPVQIYLIAPILSATPAGVAVDIWPPATLSVIVGSFLISWLLAFLCYHTIERPFLRLKAHLPVLGDKTRGHPAKA